MDEDMIEKAEAYAARRVRRVAGRLGFGIHSMVFVIEGNAESRIRSVRRNNSRELCVASYRRGPGPPGPGRPGPGPCGRGPKPGLGMNGTINPVSVFTVSRACSLFR